MTVDSVLVSSIGKGVLVFAAVAKDDTRKEVESMAAKVLKLKMWPDDTGGTVRMQDHTYLVPRSADCLIKWKQSVQDIRGEVLCGMSKMNFLHMGTVWPSELKTFSIPVHLAGINQEREQARLSWRRRWSGS